MQRGSGGDRQEVTTHRASLLIREILNLNEQFEAHLGAELTVNRTDLEAMEQLIMDGPLSPTELARRLEITTAAATTVVDRLIAVGHVTREPHPTDRRGILVVPAPASIGRAMGTLMPMIRGIDSAIDEFDPAEQATITAYLSAVATAYRTQLPTEER